MRKRRNINGILWLLEFLPKANIEIAFSGAFLSFVFAKSFEFPSPVLYGFFMFSAILAVYNLLRAVSNWRAGQLSLNLSKMAHVITHSLFAGLSFIFSVILLIALFLPFEFYLFIFLLFFFSLAYRFRWFRFAGMRVALSDLPYTKTILLSMVWTSLAAYLPMSFGDINMRLCIAVFLMIAALSIPFDVRDMYVDTFQRRTLPQLVGVKYAAMISVILYFASTIIVLFVFENSSWFWLLISNFFFSALVFSVARNARFKLGFRLLDLTPVFWGMIFF